MAKNTLISNSLLITIASLFIILSATPRADATEVVSIKLSAEEYQIAENDEGQIVHMDGFGYLLVPGKPMLPAKNFLIALPPGAKAVSVQVKGTGETQLPGTYRIVSTPPILPLVDLHQYPELMKRLQAEWRRNNQEVYSSDQLYPRVRGRLISSGTLRKYSYVSVSFYPFSYRPLSGKLIYYDGAQVFINYKLPSPGSAEAWEVEELKWDAVADEKASRLFVNYPEVKGLYEPSGKPPRGWQKSYDYVIITTENLLSAIISSGFPDWKASLGYTLRYVLTTDPEIASQSGVDLAQKIRNFLRDYYAFWGIRYVLLVGDWETVPMRYCYPDPTNHWNNAGTPNATSGENPTDYYYADLSDPDEVSWDSDGDGFYGEYGEDNPDFLAEVYVGRIPINDLARITYTLNKLVVFEQDTGDWKNKALHAGAFWYFANENHSGMPAYEGATCMNEIETNLMGGWVISHYSEQSGLAPSAYPWPSLNEEAFVNDWRNGEYSIVNWGAHGWVDGAARKVWEWDDGDSVPETQNPNEMSWPYFISSYSNLDDDHPSILFPISCVINYPEPNAWGNIGIDLLTKPSYGACVGVVGATRIVWGTSGWPTNPGGGESMCYEFNRYMIDGPGGPEKVGDALYDSKFFCNQNYGFEHYAEYWNMVTYNLYGDPALVREGTSPFARGDCNGDGTIALSDVVYLINYLYRNDEPPHPMEAGDCNCDGVVDLGDVVYLISYLFRDGPPPSC